MVKLIVPPEIKKDINKYSGYISRSSKFSQKDLKGLFKCPENVRYLTAEVYALITHEAYLENNLRDRNADYNDYGGQAIRTGWSNYSGNEKNRFDRQDWLLKEFKTKKYVTDMFVPEAVQCYHLPWPEDISIDNPVMQLHMINLQFIMSTSHNMIISADSLFSDYKYVNPDTGVDETETEYDYDAGSYTDGTWHPEDLFLNCSGNRKIGQWQELSVTLDSNPNGPRVDHIYNSPLYGHKNADQDAMSGIDMFGKKNDSSVRKTTRSQFPGWQYSVDYRPYEKDNREGLREFASQDRRTQRPHGYNITALTKKSTY